MKNEAIEKIEKIIKNVTEKYLSEYDLGEFEEDGAIYYMNGDDGTVFDWGTNGRCCEFMTFYEDDGMGAIKLNIKSSGEAEVFVFKKGDKSSAGSEKMIFGTEDDVLKLAVLMFNIADKKHLYDANIEKMEVDYRISESDEKEFLANFQ